MLDQANVHLIRIAASDKDVSDHLEADHV